MSRRNVCKDIERICFHFAVQLIGLYSISAVLRVGKLSRRLGSKSYVNTHYSCSGVGYALKFDGASFGL